MKNKFKKTMSAFAALAVAASSYAASMPVQAATADSFPYTIEAEDMKGAELWTQNYGPSPKNSSGKGFFYLTGNSASFTVTVPEDGMYTITAHLAVMVYIPSSGTVTVCTPLLQDVHKCSIRTADRSPSL